MALNRVVFLSIFFKACGEAYPQKTDAEACSTGCKGQVPVIEKRRKKMVC